MSVVMLVGVFEIVFIVVDVVGIRTPCSAPSSPAASASASEEEEGEEEGEDDTSQPEQRRTPSYARRCRAVIYSVYPQQQQPPPPTTTTTTTTRPVV